MVKDKLIRETILNIYRELYKNSTPQADFDVLVENAIIDSEGRKVIPFMDYEIEEEKMDFIINEECKKQSFNKRITDIIKTNIYLGCSPKTKKINNNERNS